MVRSRFLFAGGRGRTLPRFSGLCGGVDGDARGVLPVPDLAEAKEGRIVRLELLGSRTSGPYRLRLRSALLPDDFVRNFNILSRADEQGETVLTVVAVPVAGREERLRD